MSLRLNFIIFFIYSLVSSISFATNDCFIAREKGQIIKQEGNCNLRHSPCSTFKIALSIMGFDAGILKSPEKPKLKFDKVKEKRLGDFYKPDLYKQMLLYKLPQTPATWMKYSVIWYSQEITHQLGMKRFKDYVESFKYGNMDVSGGPRKTDGLLSSWLYSSLKISAMEMLDFISNLAELKLPVSKQAQENTIKIMSLEDYFNGWKLYGKTGGGNTGWFVGWIEKENRRIEFVQYVEPKCNPLSSAGRIAKEIAKDNLLSLIFN